MSDPLDQLATAVQTFATEVGEGAEMVDNAVLVWESVSFDEAGDVQRCIRYCVPTDNFTMSGTLGLLEAGKHYIRRDVLGSTEDDE